MEENKKITKMSQKNTVLTLLLGIFLLTTVSAIYGGETYSVEIDFEPVACSVTDNLIFNIDMKEVSIDIPINFVGNFTLTCFSGEEADPIIQYRSSGSSGGGSGRGSGSMTFYKNNTEYVDKIIEKEVSVETNGEIETLTESNPIVKILISSIALIILFLILFLLLYKIYSFMKKMEKESDQNIIEKGGEKQDE